MIKLIILIAKKFKPLDDFLGALFMAFIAHNAKNELHKASVKRLLEKQANEEIKKITAYEKDGKASGYEAPRVVGVRR